ncbi:MAG TPA: NUDIX domain-containing protein [Candidatus Paceibacterota bacterium]
MLKLAKSVFSSLNTTISGYIERQLQKGGEKYLDSINDTRPESTIAMMERLSPLLQYIKDKDTIVSIGVGQGEEICGLYELFGDRVEMIGVDISSIAIKKSKLRVARNHFLAKLIKADAVELPFADGSIDAIILSSTLHEIYSYHESGIDAFKKALMEVSRVLKSQGVVFIRDFAPPENDSTVTLHVRTPIAMKFYEFFRSSFRRFKGWNSKMDHLKLDETFLPPLGHGIVHLPFSRATELVLHFRSFWSDYQSGIFLFENPDWKEADEMYTIRNGLNPLVADQYIKTVADALGPDFSNVYKKMRSRNMTNAFLSRHFSISSPESADLIPLATRKLECVFQKDALIKKHYSAAVVFDGKGRVLLCKRGANKKIAPNMWHLPGGTIEFDESSVETVERELKEELDLNVITILPTNTVLNYRIDGDLYQTHVFWVEVSNKPTLMNSENSGFEFVDPREIASYIEPHLVHDNLHAIQAAERVRRIGITHQFS